MNIFDGIDAIPYPTETKPLKHTFEDTINEVRAVRISQEIKKISVYLNPAVAMAENIIEGALEQSRVSANVTIILKYQSGVLTSEIIYGLGK